jgi:hypothetical protein
LWWFLPSLYYKIAHYKGIQQLIIAYASILSGIQQVGIGVSNAVAAILQTLIWHGCFNFDDQAQAN